MFVASLEPHCCKLSAWRDQVLAAQNIYGEAEPLALNANLAMLEKMLLRTGPFSFKIDGVSWDLHLVWFHQVISNKSAFSLLLKQRLQDQLILGLKFRKFVHSPAWAHPGSMSTHHFGRSLGLQSTRTTSK